MGAIVKGIVFIVRPNLKGLTAIHMGQGRYAQNEERTFSYSVFEKVGGGVTQASQWKFEKIKIIILINN